jgi:hypothetical protein
MRRKIITALLCFLLLGGGFITAEGFRNIANIGFDYYFDGSFTLKIDNVFIARLASFFSLEARLLREDQQDYNNTTFFLGPIFSITPQLYTVSTYGLGIDSDGQFSHQIQTDINYETADFWAGAGARAVFYPGQNYYYGIPSAGIKIFFTPDISLLSKYFLSLANDETKSHSLWLQGEFFLGDVFSLKAGGTGGVNFEESIGKGTSYSYSIIGGAGFKISSDFTLRYTFEYLGDTADAHGIRNLLTADIRF